MIDYLALPLDETDPRVGNVYDELSLWASRFGQVLLDRVPLRSGARVLDVGCGPGFPSLELAHALGPTCTVVGLDVWAAALARARVKQSFYGVPQLTFVRGDGARLPVRDGSIDLIVSNLGVNNFANPGQALRECRRVIDARGLMLLTTNLRGHMREFYDDLRVVLEEIDDEKLIDRFEQHVQHRVSRTSLVDMLRNAGFDSVETGEDEFVLRYLDGSSFLRHGFIRLGFLPAWREVVGPEREREIFERVETRLNERAADRGELRMTIPRCWAEARP